MSYVCCTITDDYMVEYNEHEYFDNESKNLYFDFLYKDDNKTSLSVCLKTGHCIEINHLNNTVQMKKFFLTKNGMRDFLLNHKQFVYDKCEIEELLNWLTYNEVQSIVDEQELIERSKHDELHH